MSVVENYSSTSFFPSSNTSEFFGAETTNSDSNNCHLGMGLPRYHSSYQYWNHYSQHYLPQDNHLGPYSVTSLQYPWTASPHDNSPAILPSYGSYDNTPGVPAGAQTLHSGYSSSSRGLRSTAPLMCDIMTPIGGTGKVRVVKRRNTANKKERRRTVSINSAFGALRGCIPNVPTDTKLSKIKTLRLATSYIAYLMDVLKTDDPTLTKGGFKAELTRKTEGKEERRKREIEVSLIILLFSIL